MGVNVRGVQQVDGSARRSGLLSQGPDMDQYTGMMVPLIDFRGPRGSERACMCRRQCVPIDI